MKKTKTGQDIILGLNSAIDYERGKKRLRTSALENLPEPGKWSQRRISQMRTKKLEMSQPYFARVLGVKPKTVMSWEQGLKNPSGSARRVLDIINKKPEIVGLISKTGSRIPKKTQVTARRKQVGYIVKKKRKHV